jgi:hypothetical protein
MPQLLYLTLLPAFSLFVGFPGGMVHAFTMGRICGSDTKYRLAHCLDARPCLDRTIG